MPFRGYENSRPEHTSDVEAQQHWNETLSIETFQNELSVKLKKVDMSQV
jgi:hypothetical protein